MAVVSDYTALFGNGFGNWNLNTRKAVFVSYSFPDSPPGDYISGPTPLLSTAGASSFQAFTLPERELIRAAFEIWGAASGIHFIEVAGQDGDIRLGKYNPSIDFSDVPGIQGYATAAGRSFSTLTSSDPSLSGDVLLDYSGVTTRVVLHEIGHAIGFKHTHDGDPTLEPSLDTAANTVMSYSNVGFTGGLGVFDVQASNFLYGAQGSEQALQWSWDPLTQTLTQTGSGIIAGMGNANDVIFGSALADTLLGWGGNDTLNIGANDTAFGGAGNDTFVLRGNVSGVFIHSPFAYTIQGETGIDALDYSQLTLTDTLLPLQDRIIEFTLNTNGIEKVIGSSDGDWIRANYSPTALGDRIYVDGGPGDDWLDLRTAVATIIIRPGGGHDFVTAADFRALPYFSSPNRTVIDLSAMPNIDSIADLQSRWTLVPRYGDGVLVYGFDFGGGTTLEISGFSSDAPDRVAFPTSSTPRYFSPSNFIFSAFFTEGNDTRTLTEADRTWLALAGHDSVTGTSGADTIQGQDGNDTLQGGGGADSLSGANGSDVITGGAGADTIDGGFGDDIIYATHDDGDDTITGGNGFDIMDLSQVNGVVQINQLSGAMTGSAGNDFLVDTIEQIKGTNFNDVLSGGHGINVLDGEGGADQFFGNNGDDLMRGGTGDDTFYFSTNDGNDTLLGGDGFDILDYSSLLGVVQVNQLAGTTTGTANNDILSDVFEMVIGTSFGDVLSGGHGINSLKGNGGDDQIFANNGDDYTSGGDGNDTITMGVGNDTHDFRNGEDVDTILDFTAGGTDDTITLTFYSGLGSTSFDAAFQARLSTVSGHAELALNGGDRIIFNNVASHTLLTAADFVFV